MAPVSQVTCRREAEARRPAGRQGPASGTAHLPFPGGGTVSGKAGEMPTSHPLSPLHTPHSAGHGCPPAPPAVRKAPGCFH